MDIKNIESFGEKVVFSPTKIEVKESLNDPIFLSIFDSENIEILVKENAKVEMFIELNNLSEKDVKISVENRGFLTLIKLFKGDNNNLKYIENVEGISNEFKEVLIDLGIGNVNIMNNINSYSFAKLSCASVTEKNYVKTITNKLTNLLENTTCLMDNYAVSFDEGKLVIEGVGSIVKKAYKSTNIQKATLFVMDKTSKVECRPILLIDCDDVNASHANALGEIAEESLFYLQSRGIDPKKARKMIVLGYFKKFIEEINSNKIKETLLKFLEEVIQSV